MVPDPLSRPGPDSEVLQAFLRHFGLPDALPRDLLLRELIRAFGTLPYENLTKIIKHAACGSAEASRRGPAEVVADHVALGAGGTCFSLTACLLHLVRALGFEAEPILADRRYGPDTHCALVVEMAGDPHLVDPGFLLLDPVPIRSLDPAPDAGGGAARPALRVRTAFNEVVLERRPGGGIELATVQQGSRTARLTFHPAPCDAGRFLEAWNASFGWDMMRYPLLTRVAGGSQLYLQAGRFLTRRHEGADRSEIPVASLPELIGAKFGVRPDIAARALEVLRSRGEPAGP